MEGGRMGGMWEGRMEGGRKGRRKGGQRERNQNNIKTLCKNAREMMDKQTDLHIGCRIQ